MKICSKEQAKLKLLQAHLNEGVQQIKQEDFVTVTSPEELDRLFKDIRSAREKSKKI